MSLAQTPIRSRRRSQSPALRLLHGQGSGVPEPLRGRDSDSPALHAIDGPNRVLLAGGDAGRRAALLDELTHTLSPSTLFEHADAVCEVLEHAPGSRMAFIAGDLNDAPAESLMQTLAHRHPELPVLIVDSPIRGGGGYGPRDDALRIQHA